jgi:hypothetical protein
MRTGAEPPEIRKIQALADQESRFVLSRIPNQAVRLTGQPFFENVMNVVTMVGQNLRKAER